MATLVLSSVGAAVGGPIGSAVGAVLGQAIDAKVLAPKRRQGPRLTELRVQTSSYGTQLPQLFGTMRVAGTVIWATDLIEHRGSSGGGKGQAKTTTYSYTASFAVALSSRPIRSVGRIWADGKLLRGAGGDWKAKTGFRLHTGNEAQAPDPLIAAAEGPLAPAHRGIAYAVFEDLALADFGNRIPSLTFEVVADAAPVSAGAIAAALAAELTVDGTMPALDGFVASGDSVRAVLETLADPAGAWFASDGAGVVMRAGPGDTVTIAADPVADGAARSIAPADTVARSLTLLHHDPARDWQAGAQTVTRGGVGMRRERVELAAALTADAARAIAGAMLARRMTMRARRRVTPTGDPLAVAAGARVRLVGETTVWRVRQVTVTGLGATLDLVAIDANDVARVATAGRVAMVPDIPAGRTLLRALELPALDDVLLTRPRLTILAGGEGAGWRRATLRVSVDGGASWIDVDDTAAPATVGTLTSALAAGPATLIDRAARADVTLAHEGMMLHPADAAALDAGSNLALVGDELVQFADAVRLDARRWRIGTLRRGVRATPIAAHTAGTSFALVEAASVRSVDLPTEAIGGTATVLASGVGDGDPVIVEATLRGASLRPPAPVAVWRDGDVLRWRRRGRTGWRWLDGVDVPLSEESERYLVELGAGARGRVTTDGPVLALTADERVAGTVVAVTQLGTWGPSPAATIIL